MHKKYNLHSLSFTISNYCNCFSFIIRRNFFVSSLFQKPSMETDVTRGLCHHFQSHDSSAYNVDKEPLTKPFSLGCWNARLIAPCRHYSIYILYTVAVNTKYKVQLHVCCGFSSIPTKLVTKLTCLPLSFPQNIECWFRVSAWKTEVFRLLDFIKDN